MIASERKNLRALAVLLLALACCSCAGRPLQGVLIPSTGSAVGTSQVPILIATTRQPATDDPGQMFSGKRSPTTSYAKIVVSIPPEEVRQAGTIQWPISPPGDPHRDFVTLSAENLDKPAFNTVLAANAKGPHRSNALIFVHGFNNRFDDAVYRLAQVVQDSGAPVIPVLFSWPSLGTVGLGSYRYDLESASLSRDNLDQLIETVSHNPSVKEVTILCHSMGCAVTLDALQSRAARAGNIGAKIRSVLLVAPDVDTNAFREQMPRMGTRRPRFALFVSRDDRALRLSSSISGGTTRLGGVNPDEEPYKSDFRRENILVFDLTHLEGRAHSRAFHEARTVTEMIGRRLVAGQQLAAETSGRD